MNKRATRALAPFAVLLGLVLAGGCVDEETVFVDRPVFDLPSDTVFNMLGYYADASNLDDPYAAKQTSCGNCHATFQKGWLATAHADAWEGLQSSSHASESCENCHTVNHYGNVLTDSAGHALTQDPRYHDVQCESCHGPGGEHAAAPSTGNAPLCAVETSTTATYGCGECHQDAHHPFVEQWEESRHGSTPAWDESGSTRTSSRCTPCHEGRNALRVTFNEPSNYLERDGTDPLPIHCVVCHDPHDATYEHQLRADIGAQNINNLCIRCHSRRGTPPSSHGPHAAQGLLVLGENVGWLAPDFLAPNFGGFLPETHAHGESDEMCATCHVSTFTVEEPEFFSSVGHTFEAISCLDPVTGIPVPGPCTNDDRDFRACDACHGDGGGQAELEAIEIVLNGLLDELWFDEDADCVLDVGDGGLLPEVVFVEGAAPPDTVGLALDPRDDLITVAEGALWNAQLTWSDSRPCWGSATFYEGVLGWEDTSDPPDGIPDEYHGIHIGAHQASGRGVHNPDLLIALLDASIEAVINFYGVGGL